MFKWKEEVEEWWGKHTETTYMFFKCIARSFEEQSFWRIFEDGEVVAEGKANDLAEAKYSVETALFALTME